MTAPETPWEPAGADDPDWADPAALFGEEPVARGAGPAATAGSGAAGVTAGTAASTVSANATATTSVAAAVALEDHPDGGSGTLPVFGADAPDVAGDDDLFGSGDQGGESAFGDAGSEGPAFGSLFADPFGPAGEDPYATTEDDLFAPVPAPAEPAGDAFAPIGPDVTDNAAQPGHESTGDQPVGSEPDEERALVDEPPVGSDDTDGSTSSDSGAGSGADTDVSSAG